MATTRGFDHLPLINKSIRELYRAFGPLHVKKFTTNFVLGPLAAHIRRDPVIGTQHLARRIAEFYCLPVTTVVVTFSRKLVPPGRVELSGLNEFFVELQSQLKNEPKAVAAVLAHEVAHIFLHRCGVRFTDDFENEVLTDTTATYVGFGPTILNAATDYGVYGPAGTLSHIQYHHFGYLTLDEFGYVQAKRDHAFGMDTTSVIDAGFPKSGFVNGRQRFKLESNARPYTRPLTQHITQFVRRFMASPTKTSKGGHEMLQFACLCCSQKLRIPTLGKQVSARCPVCDSRHICFT